MMVLIHCPIVKKCSARGLCDNCEMGGAYETLRIRQEAAQREIKLLNGVVGTLVKSTERAKEEAREEERVRISTKIRERGVDIVIDKEGFYVLSEEAFREIFGVPDKGFYTAEEVRAMTLVELAANRDVVIESMALWGKEFEGGGGRGGNDAGGI